MVKKSSKAGRQPQPLSLIYDEECDMPFDYYSGRQEPPMMRPPMPFHPMMPLMRPMRPPMMGGGMGPPIPRRLGPVMPLFQNFDEEFMEEDLGFDDYEEDMELDPPPLMEHGWGRGRGVPLGMRGRGPAFGFGAGRALAMRGGRGMAFGAGRGLGWSVGGVAGGRGFGAGGRGFGAGGPQFGALGRGARHMPPNSEAFAQREPSIAEHNIVNIPRDVKALFKPLECGMCVCVFNADNQAELHYVGKNHFAKLKTLLRMRGVDPIYYEGGKGATTNGKRKATDDSYEKHCECCDVSLTSAVHAKQHFEGKKHSRVMQGLPPEAVRVFDDKTGKWVEVDYVEAKEKPEEKVLPFSFTGKYNKQQIAAKKEKLAMKPDKNDKPLDFKSPEEKALELLESADDELPMSFTGRITSKEKSSTVIQEPPSKKARSTIENMSRCELCDIDLSSELVANDHYSGKRHLKELNKTFVETPKIFNPHLNKWIEVPQIPSGFAGTPAKNKKINTGYQGQAFGVSPKKNFEKKSGSWGSSSGRGGGASRGGGAVRGGRGGAASKGGRGGGASSRGGANGRGGFAASRGGRGGSGASRGGRGGSFGAKPGGDSRPERRGGVKRTEKKKKETVRSYCDTCQVDLTSEEHANQHFSGRKHQRVAQGLPVEDKIYDHNTKRWIKNPLDTLILAGKIPKMNPSKGRPVNCTLQTAVSDPSQMTLPTTTATTTSSFGNQVQSYSSFGSQGQNSSSYGKQGQTGSSFGNQAKTGSSFGNQAKTGSSFGKQGKTGGSFGNQGKSGGSFGNQGKTGAYSTQGQTGAHSNQGQTGAYSNQGQTNAYSNQGQTGAFSNQLQTGAFSNQGQTGAFSNQLQTGAFSNQGQPISVLARKPTPGVVDLSSIELPTSFYGNAGTGGKMYG